MQPEQVQQPTPDHVFHAVVSHKKVRYIIVILVTLIILADIVSWTAVFSRVDHFAEYVPVVSTTNEPGKLGTINAQFNTKFEAKIGQMIKVGSEGLEFKLMSVDDSRCPADPNVACVVAGTLKAKAELFTSDGLLGEIDVEVGKKVTLGGHVVNLLNVVPKERKMNTQLSEYILTFQIDELSPAV
jgi:hypothetical protein